MSRVVNKEPTAALPVQRFEDANADTPKQASNGKTNVYGFIADNLDAADIYICFFDKETAPTPGSDPVALSFKVSAESTFGRDPGGIPLAHFASKCWVVAGLAPDGTGLITAEPVIQVWVKE